MFRSTDKIAAEVKNPITIAQLIEYLKNFPEEATVFSDEWARCYKSIDEIMDFDEEYNQLVIW